MLELFLVEELAARDAVDLRAQLRDAILVGESLFGVARDQAREHVVVEGEIGSGRKRPAPHDHEAANHDPEGDRAEAELAAGVAERVAARRVAVPRTVSAMVKGEVERLAERFPLYPDLHRV